MTMNNAFDPFTGLLSRACLFIGIFLSLASWDLHALPDKEKSRGNNPGEIFREIESKSAQILAYQDELKLQYGTTMDQYLQKQQELEEIKTCWGRRAKHIRLQVRRWLGSATAGKASLKTLNAMQ